MNDSFPEQPFRDIIEVDTSIQCSNTINTIILNSGDQQLHMEYKEKKSLHHIYRIQR